MSVLILLGAIAILLGILGLATVIALTKGAIVALLIIGGVLVLIDLGPGIGARWRR